MHSIRNPNLTLGIVRTGIVRTGIVRTGSVRTCIPFKFDSTISVAKRYTNNSTNNSVNNFKNHYDVVRKELDARESFFKLGGTLILSPFMVPLGFFSIPAKHRAVLTVFGKYQETISEGLHWRAPVGLGVRQVFTGKNSYNLPKSKIVDKNGNPVIVSGTINYTIEFPEKYVLNINADASFVRNQAEIVLKKVTSAYPYQSDDQKCLIREGGEIKTHLVEELQNLVEHAGVKIEDFYLTDICYAPEIAQQMLIRQRAMAYIEAKDKIGQASIGIIQKIINDVESKLNIELTEDKKTTMINNLLVVMTSEANIQPVIPLESGERR